MKIDHIGIAVADIETSIAMYTGAFGLRLGQVEEIGEQGIRAHHLQVGETRIELLEPLDEDSPIGRFLARHGQGIHHIAFAVDDFDAERTRMIASGLESIGEPSIGAGGKRIQFFHPRSTGGVLIEICSGGTD
jgi:methylmalonyl-CoA/ethylmalonyl-CoA epimerase